MNYRHAFHAGNFADVVKHIVLVAVLQRLKKKAKPFRVIDTHAGRGLYVLGGEEARRTGEAAQGVARLDELDPADATLPPALAAYLAIVRKTKPHYPGSPLIAAECLREGDRLIAIERRPDDAEALSAVLKRFPNASAHCADGYARLPALLPPPERRGLVLIDPPYEAEDEFGRVAVALHAARKRFATGIYMLWFPMKSAATADALSGEVRLGGTDDVLRIVIDIGTRNIAPDSKERLSAAGLLVVNPPFGLAEEIKAAAPILVPRLGRGTRAQLLIEPL